MIFPECANLDRYLAGELSPGRSARFEGHLAGCPACRRALDHQRHIDRLLLQAAGQLEPGPSSLIDRIEKELRAENRRRTVRSAWGLSAAAAVVLGLGLWLAEGHFHASDLSQPIVQKETKPATEPDPLDPPTPAPRDPPRARVSLADRSSAIVLPVETENPNVTLVWVYPTVRPLQAAGAPAIDYPSSQPVQKRGY